MFLDFMLESGIYQEPEVISEETLEEIENLEIKDFTESTETPFEIVSRSIYEFAKENADTMMTIGKAEIRYLKENGVEPIWEASDHESLMQRFIGFLKGLLSKITSAFGKLIDMVNTKINSIVDNYGSGMFKAVSGNMEGLRKNIAAKKIKIKTYDTSSCEKFLQKNVTDVLVTNGNNVTKLLYGKIVKGNLSDSEIQELNSIVNNGKETATTTAFRVTMLSDIKAIKPEDCDSMKAIKNKIQEEIVTTVENASADQIMDEIKVALQDQRGAKLKADLKKAYNNIRTRISKIIDDCKRFETAAKGTDTEKLSSRTSGLFQNLLKTYSEVASLVYNSVTQCLVSRWFQSLKLIHVLKANGKPEKEKKGKEELIPKPA